MPKNRVCANSASLPRRTFLTGAVATPMLCASPAMAEPGVGSGTELAAYERGFKDAQRRITGIIQNLSDQNIPTDPKHTATREMWELFDQWMTARKNLEYIPEQNEDVFGQEFAEVSQIATLIHARAPRSGTDMLIKILTDSGFGGLEVAEGLWLEAIACLGLADDSRAMI